MSFCNENGIPHSEFLDWDPVDRAKALAFALEASERCTLCGTAPWEWEENPHAYDAGEKFCKGCYIKQTTSDSSDSRTPGTTVTLFRNTKQRQAKLAVSLAKRRKMNMESYRLDSPK